jgi:hypothetical protein
VPLGVQILDNGSNTHGDLDVLGSELSHLHNRSPQPCWDVKPAVEDVGCVYFSGFPVHVQNDMYTF